jgi:hypothetical protein
MKTPMVVDLPSDPEFLKQYARASMAHAHLDNALKMFIRSFRELTVEEALKYVGYRGAKHLREEIKRLAREQLPEGEALDMALDYMSRCEAVSERRNELLHSPTARVRDGDKFLMRVRGGEEWMELPTPDALRSLANETLALAEEMSHERLGGVIGLALHRRKEKST